MDSLQFYDDHIDENEGVEEVSPKMQPDFSVNEVEIEEVSVVVETQELEVEEVVEVVTFKNNAHDEEDDLRYIEGRTNPESKDLDEFEKGEEESADPSMVPEAEECTQAPIPVDQMRELVDLNKETCETDMDFTASGGDELITEKDEVPLKADTEAMEDDYEGTGMLQQMEPDGKHALTSVEVANGFQTVESDALDMEADGQQPPPEPATEPADAVSDGRSAGEDPLEAPADSAENDAIVNEDANEKQIGSSEHAETGRKGSALNPENVTDSDDDNAQAAISSGSKENPNVEVGLGSAEQLFNDANLAQLKAQIIVMGILRKGSKPSEDLLISACPTSIKGTPSATVAEDIGTAAIGDPSSLRKRKSLDNEAVPSGSDGITNDLMMSIKDNLHLSQSRDVLLLDDTDRQLRSAQISAHDAMATATSALAQSHIAWAQVRSEDLSETGIAREAQIASVAATVAAAASVAQAAVEAAKAIANVSIKAFMQGGPIANGQPSGFQSKGKNKSSSAKNRKSEMLDSVVKAAGMAAEAATQAGTVLGFAHPLMQVGIAGGPRKCNAGEVNEAVGKASPKKMASRKRKASPKKMASKKSTGDISASPKTTPLKVSKDGSKKKNDDPARGKVAKEYKPSKTEKDNRQPALPAKSTVPNGDLLEAGDGGDINEKSESIARGSLVEIMTAEVGLRGGWFSGKVLRVTKGQAFVVYDEILNDDGSKLEEWFPFKASGDPAGPRRQVRPVHPYSSIREPGSKKRRRVAMGSQTWTVGDHVDGFIQDAWWEGIFSELNDVDETKAVVYFPGENDTQTVKVWDLRPSLQWEDGKWVLWVDSTVTEKQRLRTQRKEGGSSSKAKNDKPVKANVLKVTAKSKKAKKIPRKPEAPSNEADESIPPRPTRKGKAQGLSSKATKEKDNPKKSEDSRNKVDESISSRSTRQGNLQELSAKGPKSKKTSKNLEVPVIQVDEPSPSRSTRKRKGPELSAIAKKGKENPRVLGDQVVAPTTTRSTRSSPGGKKLDNMAIARDSSGKKSIIKISDEKHSGGKKAKVSSKAPQKDISTLGAPKKLDLNVGTLSTVKTTKKSETSEVTMTRTRGKLKAEETNKRSTRR